MQERPYTPTNNAIFRHWKEERKTFPDLAGSIHCFACGSASSRLERAHLIPYEACRGSSLDNLVLLCKRCHREAPIIGVSARPMIDWINRRESEISFAVRRGLEELKAIDGLMEGLSLVPGLENMGHLLREKLEQIRAGVHTGGDPMATVAYAASLVCDDLAVKRLDAESCKSVLNSLPPRM